MVVIDKMDHCISDAQEVGHVIRDHKAAIDPVVCDVICIVTFSWQPYLCHTFATFHNFSAFTIKNPFQKVAQI